MNNKGRRNELRNLKWKKRLKNYGLTRVKNRDFICFRDQGKPCSCSVCKRPRYKRSIKHKQQNHE